MNHRWEFDQALAAVGATLLGLADICLLHASCDRVHVGRIPLTSMLMLLKDAAEAESSLQCVHEIDDRYAKYIISPI